MSRATQEIPLATTHGPDGGDGGPIPCAELVDCAEGSFCSKGDCGDPMGTCERLPSTCSDEEDDVCACDHVTYFSDCNRRSAGVPAATPGRCPPKRR